MVYIFEFFYPRDKYVTSKAGDAKKMVCWLPMRKAITWEDSRNITVDLKNSKTDIKHLASFLLTPKMPREDSRNAGHEKSG